jgi:hypothetical protein
MSDTPDRTTGHDDPASEPSDGPLRIYAEHLGIDFDAVVAQAQRWVAEHPLPPDLGPEPFNVGPPRPPADAGK